jgi:hypothetical protein
MDPQHENYGNYRTLISNLTSRGEAGGGGQRLFDAMDAQKQYDRIKLTRQAKRDIKSVIENNLFAIHCALGDIFLNMNKQKIKNQPLQGARQQFKVSQQFENNFKVISEDIAKKWYTILCMRSLAYTTPDFQTRQRQASDILKHYEKDVENPTKEYLTTRILDILVERFKQLTLPAMMKKDYLQRLHREPTQQQIRQQKDQPIDPRHLQTLEGRAKLIALQIKLHIDIELTKYFIKTYGDRGRDSCLEVLKS